MHAGIRKTCLQSRVEEAHREMKKTLSTGQPSILPSALTAASPAVSSYTARLELQLPLGASVGHPLDRERER
jgi:hypothetical protein